MNRFFSTNIVLEDNSKKANRLAARKKVMELFNLQCEYILFICEKDYIKVVENINRVVEAYQKLSYYTIKLVVVNTPIFSICKNNNIIYISKISKNIISLLLNASVLVIYIPIINVDYSIIDMIAISNTISIISKKAYFHKLSKDKTYVWDEEIESLEEAMKFCNI